MWNLNNNKTFTQYYYLRKKLKVKENGKKKRVPKCQRRDKSVIKNYLQVLTTLKIFIAYSVLLIFSRSSFSLSKLSNWISPSAAWEFFCDGLTGDGAFWRLVLTIFCTSSCVHL